MFFPYFLKNLQISGPSPSSFFLPPIRLFKKVRNNGLNNTHVCKSYVYIQSSFKRLDCSFVFFFFVSSISLFIYFLLLPFPFAFIVWAQFIWLPTCDVYTLHNLYVHRIFNLYTTEPMSKYIKFFNAYQLHFISSNSMRRRGTEIREKTIYLFNFSLQIHSINEMNLVGTVGTV